LLAAATRGLRADGRLGHLAYVLAIQGIVAARLADWDVAIPAAEEAWSLAGELRQPLLKAGGDIVSSTIAGMRGDKDAAEEAAAEAERIATPTGANNMVALARAGESLLRSERPDTLTPTRPPSVSSIPPTLRIILQLPRGSLETCRGRTAYWPRQ
jgi:hypothetical protein